MTGSVVVIHCHSRVSPEEALKASVMECIGLERTTNGPVVVHCGNGEQVLIGGRQARCH